MARLQISLKSARVNKNLTQRQAADFLGISVETIANYESAKSFPDVPMIQKMEKLYGVEYKDIDFLLKNTV